MQKPVMQTIVVLHHTQPNIEDRAQAILDLEEKHVYATRGTLNFENRLIQCISLLGR